MWRIFHGSGARTPHHSTSNAWQSSAADAELALSGPGLRAPPSSLPHLPQSPSPAYPSHTFSLDVGERPSSLSGAVFIGFLLLMLVVSLLPSSFLLWLVVGLFIAVCLRALQQMRHRRPRPPAPSAPPPAARAARVSRIPDNSAWVIFHRDQPVSLDALNAQLSLISRDFNSAAFSPRLASEHPPRPDPAAAEVLSDSDILSFPVHQYRRAVRHQRPAAVQQQRSSMEAARVGAGPGPPRKDGRPSGGAAHAAGAGAAEQQLRRGAAPPRAGAPSWLPGSAAAAAGLGLKSRAGPAGSEDESEGGGGGGGDGDGQAAAAGEPGPWTCVVCLDSYRDGDSVMTLPCMHHFHQACLVPWLQRQGKRSACPMCKTPCFS